MGAQGALDRLGVDRLTAGVDRVIKPPQHPEPPFLVPVAPVARPECAVREPLGGLLGVTVIARRNHRTVDY